MNTAVCLYFCLFLLSGLRDSVKAFSNVLHFDPGVMYEYEYSTSTAVAPISVDLEVSSVNTLEAVIQIHSLWRNAQNQEEQLLHMKILDLKLTNSSDTNKDLTVEKTPDGFDHIKEAFIVHLLSGKIQGILDISKDSTAWLNFKKGLASMFQIQTSSGIIVEDDATGQCQVSYHTIKDEIIKLKDYENCKKSVTSGMISEQILGVNLAGNSKTVFTMEDGHIKSATSQEILSVVLDEQSTVGVQISSRQFLQILSKKSSANEEAHGEQQEVLTSFKKSHVNHTLHAIPVRQSAHNGHSINDLLNYLKATGMNMSLSATTNVFLQLSQSLHNMELNEIKNILKKSDSMLVPILIEAAAAASTPAALDAVVSYLDLTDPKTAPLLEQFLYACAFSSNPSPHLISVISNIVSHTKAQSQTHQIALIIFGTVIRKMCSANMCNMKEVEDAKRLILNGLSASKDETEIKSHLLALKSALLPETVPILLQYIDRSKSLSNIVLSTLENLPSQYINKEVKQHVRDIFTQRKKSFSAPVRVAAAQLLLRNDPLLTDVEEVILRIAKEKPEISKFLTAKIMNILQSTDTSIRNLTLNVLKDSKLNNYFHLARVGSSSSYTGQIAETKDTITTYDFDFVFSESGALKQSNSHFSTQSKRGSLHSLQVSLELGGFDSLFGKEFTEEEEEELMAGMSAMFLGVQIKPIVFFQGYGDLMSKYFSAAEGPMNILSGNILIIRMRQSLILQSGLQTHVYFHGGLSVDVSADLEFSLFGQESKSSVKNKFSIVITSRAEVDALFMSTIAETLSEMNSSFSFITTVNFSDTPMIYCLQLIREPLLYRERASTQVTTRNRRKTLQDRRRTWIIPGEETALHKDNSRMCRKLLNFSTE
ncbi:microsomal triglyceride transfer protein large subunit-like [Hoplias malabaricus]|uniref:microsomal triglyceride transfer protein large subunit-like n=1 Tax=Hoplias malabaricus TaxID=27720 RepID=UPI0034635AEC